MQKMKDPVLPLEGAHSILRRRISKQLDGQRGVQVVHSTEAKWITFARQW